MNIISSKNIINIIRKALNLIDGRLIHHGERVSYILLKMLQSENEYNPKEILTYTMAGIFHDIGAYKKEEVDNMVQFESNNVWGHSIYGYLFLKYLSPLDESAEAVLFHHLDYEKLAKYNSKSETVAAYLNLADKIDSYIIISQKAFDHSFFEKYRDTKFSGKALDTFQKAEQKFQVLSNIADNSYLEELNQIFEEAVFSHEEKENFLHMLIYSIDFRSEYTVMHTITTVSIADEIGRLLDLQEQDQTILHYGALLHDVGKIATPIEILEAPRKLSASEMGIMKNHVVVSEYILKDFIDSETLEVAIRHHEKLDGSGYPKGIEGDELTLPQRIIAVADIVSALSGTRSYKDSFNKMKIFDILTLEVNQGKLCPKVVECVIKHFDELMENVKKYTNEPLQMYSDMQTKYEDLYELILDLDKK